MSGYLDRYVAGEHQAVWDELRSLGPAAHSEPVRAEATAVAHETMSRVRGDVELIAARLADIGYRFGFAWNPESTESGNTDLVIGPPRPDLQQRWAELAAHDLHLPLSLRAFYEVVGSVNLVGSYIPPEELDDLADGEHWTKYFGADDGAPDPLHVVGFDDALDDFLLGDWVESTRSFRRYTLGSPEIREHGWLISPDECHLYGFSGGDGLHIEVAVPSTDADLGSGPPFVDHLRDHILARGGFGWGDDEDADHENAMPESFRDRLVADLRPF